MLAAAERLVGAHGGDHLTVTALTAEAHVSRTTFYATFADREDCLLALFDDVADRLGAAMFAAYTAERQWLDGVRASLRVLLASLDSQPEIARFLIVGGVSGDSALVVRRRRVLAELARSLESGSPAADPQGAAGPFGSQALVNGAASIVHSRLLEDPVPALLDLAGSLMAVLVLPFVGEGVARRELARRASAGRV
jgi:AcrR family transcriptional regulator